MRNGCALKDSLRFENPCGFLLLMGAVPSSFAAVRAWVNSDLAGRGCGSQKPSPLGKVARAAGRKRSSPHVTPRAYARVFDSM